MEIKVDQHEGRIPVTVFHIDGSVDSNTHAELEKQVRAAIETGAQHILLDLKRVPFMSSAGLHAIHNIFIQLRSKNPDVSDEEMRTGINSGTYKSPNLKLCRPSANVKKVLEMGGFDMYLDVFPDVDGAVAAF
jgi:anti-anti-sigma factor